MEAGEETAPSKQSKPTSSTQEIPASPYPDWSSSTQAYYAGGAPGTPFFATHMAPPSPHPYMWGAQHPMMTPYGTPVPYPAMYPPGGIYAHHPMTMAPSPAQTNPETIKDQFSTKKPKRAAVKGKDRDGGKAASDSGNNGVSGSDETQTEEGSSAGSHENANQQEDSANKKRSFKKMLADASPHNNATGAIQASTRGTPIVPAANLHMGIDLWSPSTGLPANIRPNASGAIVSAPMPEQWVQDERELKRQKRKQSNRESARRSRMRKQAECEQLQQRVDSLTNENDSLKEELRRLSEECEKLTTENNSIKDDLTRICGPEAVANLEQPTNADLLV